jgi:hypothetical protein
VILPKISSPGKTEGSLKQSELPNLIHGLEAFLMEVSSAFRDMQALQSELSRHKEFHLDVLTRLSEEGDVYEMIEELEAIKPNSSDEITARCGDMENFFHYYEQRAKKIRGANFPSFMEELDQFMKECRLLKDQHERMIFEYQRKAKHITNQLQAVSQEIIILRNEEPVLEWDWSPLLDELTQLQDLTSLETRKWSVLRDFIYAGESAIQKANLDQRTYQEEFFRCKAEYDEVPSTLEQIHNGILQREVEIRQGWAWKSVSSEEDFKEAAKAASRLEEAWQEAWQQARMQDVLGKCAQIRKAAGQILVDLDLNLQEIRQLQKSFDGQYHLIEAALESPGRYRLDKYESAPELLGLLAELIQKDRDQKVVAWALSEAGRVTQQAMRDLLDQSTVFLLLTQIKSGQYKQSAAYDIEAVGN